MGEVKNDFGFHGGEGEAGPRGDQPKVPVTSSFLPPFRERSFRLRFPA